MRIILEAKRDWDPSDHPRDPRNGKFVERRFGRVRIDPTNTGLFFTPTMGIHKRPNAQATHFENLPAEHRAKMYEQWRKQRKGTGTDARTYPDLIRNVKALWDEAPPETKQEGRLWYRRAKQAAERMSAEHGVSVDETIAAIAALSPQQQWETNVALADWTIGKVVRDERIEFSPDEVERLLNPPGDLASIDVREANGKRISELQPGLAATALHAMIRREDVKADFPGHEAMLADGSRARQVSLSGGSPPLEAAISVLQGGEPDDILNGHKVRSFFNNIQDPDNLLGGDDVTVDTHATQAALDVLHFPAGGGEKAKAGQMDEKNAAAAMLAGTPSSKDLNMSGLYAMFASAYREVAKDVGIPPNQVQATVWTHWKAKKEAQR